MKLITKINLNFLSAALAIFFVGSIACYYVVQQIALKHIDFQLQSASDQVLADIDTLALQKQPISLHGNMLTIEKVKPEVRLPSFADTLILEANWPRGHYRYLTVYERRHDFSYRVRIHKSLQLADELVVRMMFGLALVVAVFLLTFFFLNRFVAIRSLGDFFETLQSLRHFRITDPEPRPLPETDIDELEQLNTILHDMMVKLRFDYINLKEFTENASHEIQTPLAIINTQVEQLIQKEGITEDHMHHLGTILEASTRLSNLNKGLLLLAKIENRQFEGIKPINLKAIIGQQLEILSEFWEEKSLTITESYPSDFSPSMHPYLAELLVFNLLKNTIKHNHDQGKIHIELQGTTLRLRNTGDANPIDDTKVFERFVKGKHSKSMGLGLAIVRKICELYQISATYSFEAPFHCIEISFPKQVVTNL